MCKGGKQGEVLLRICNQRGRHPLGHLKGGFEECVGNGSFVVKRFCQNDKAGCIGETAFLVENAGYIRWKDVYGLDAIGSPRF